MQVLTIKTRVGSDGHLHLDIPTKMPPGEVELVLVVNNTTTPAEIQRYDFSDLCGRLQWTGDAVAEQRKLRDEW